MKSTDFLKNDVFFSVSHANSGLPFNMLARLDTVR